MEMGRELTAGLSHPPPPPPPPPPPQYNSLVPGFRFHPTDEELVRYYLRRKICKRSSEFEMVSEVDVYKSEPWELADHTTLNSKNLEWYFFTPLDKKYATSSRISRATLRGFWKETGAIREVSHMSEKIGQKKTLIFHVGRPPRGKRTDWVMHEYKLVDKELETAGVAQDAFVLCRIYQKDGVGPSNGDHCAPFFDEEWDDEADLFVPGGDKKDDVTNDDETCAERNNTTQMDPETIPGACKTIRSENGALITKLDLDTFTLSHHKASKGSDPSSSKANGSDDSTTTSQVPQTTNLASALVEHPLPDPIAAKETHPPATPLSFDASALEKSLPPGHLEFIIDLENKIRDVSMEKEVLKIELVHARAALNALQSRLDQLSKENIELRRGV